MTEYDQGGVNVEKNCSLHNKRTAPKSTAKLSRTCNPATSRLNVPSRKKLIELLFSLKCDKWPIRARLKVDVYPTPVIAKNRS